MHTTNHNLTVFITDGYPTSPNVSDPVGSKPPISILDDNHFCDTVNGVFSEHNSDFKNAIFFISGVNGHLAPYDTTFLQHCFDGFKKYDNTYQEFMSGTGGYAENLYYFVLSLLDNTSVPVDEVSFYPTAVDDNGDLLVQGSFDSHWIIMGNHDQNTRMPAYVEDLNNYIGPSTTGDATLLGDHTYTQIVNDGGYRLSFDVFSRAGDSEPVNVSLNNTEIYAQQNHYSVCLPNNAKNTLNFVVYHQQASVLSGIKVINVKNEGIC